MYIGIDTVATSGSAVAPRAGANRIVVCFVFHLNATAAATVTALTWNGVSGTFITRLQGGTLTPFSDVEAWYFKDSAVPATSTALAWTLSAVATESRAVLVTFSNLSQTDTLRASAVYPAVPSDTLTASAPVLTTGFNNDLVMGVINQTPASITWSSFTEVLDSVITTSAQTAVAYQTNAATGSTTQTATWVGASKAAGVLVSFNPEELGTVVPVVHSIVQPVVNRY